MSSVQSPTVTELLLARADDQHAGLRFGDRCWTWREHVAACAEHAVLLQRLRRPDVPFHVGVLSDNRPEYSFLLGAAALAGAVLVGLNPARRGAALARDIRLADCQLVVVDPSHAELMHGLELDVPVLEFDSPSWYEALAEHRGSRLTPVPAAPDDLLMLIFTSGTSGEPKAVRCTHGKVAFPGRMLADRFGLSTVDTVYVSMPMFHSNAIMAGWAVGLAAGATIALRGKFSASGFLPDVRRFGATYANYVGKPMSYVLQTPELPDDADNPLRLVYGNEGAEADLAEFGSRFGCQVVDGFGSTEGGVAVPRTSDTPPGALGRPVDGVAVLDPESGRPCPPAVFDADGRVANPEEAVGELVNTAGAGWFAGYYNDPASDGRRLRDGKYWSGDLAYLDTNGFCYFVGRAGDWLRVDGENLGTAPIERILLRHKGIAEVAVFAVPDPKVGDQIMAAIVPRAGVTVDPTDLAAFLCGQPDLSPIQRPRFLRIATELPRTSTYKVVKRRLTAERWACADPVWWRPGRQSDFERLTEQQAAALDAAVGKR